MQILYIISLGFILSFVGQLPIGTISLTATQIAVQENFRNAWKYSIGVALAEMVYLRLVLSGLGWMIVHPFMLSVYTWISILFFLVLGSRSLINSLREKRSQKALLLENEMNRFVLGLCLSAFNPAQLPFWIFWTGYFLNMRWLLPGTANFNLFTVGTGAGTIAGLTVYMYCGNYLITKMNTSNKTLNQLVGIVFIFAALLQVYRVIWH